MEFYLRQGGFLIWVFCQTQILLLEQLVTDKQWNTFYDVGNMEVGILLGTSMSFYLNFRKHLEILQKGR